MPTTTMPPPIAPAIDDPAWESFLASITRRDLIVGGSALAAVTALAACGDDDGDAPSGNSIGQVVEHRYGGTEVPAGPERVVTVGLVDHDAVLALGVVPVALTADDYSADQPHGAWPWAQDLLDGAVPDVLPGAEVNFERIAALEPDLILAVYAGITDQDYRTLSAIAPTVAQPTGHADYQAPWDVMTRHIGRALGQEARANELIDEVERTFADARAAHPEFAGKIAVYAGTLGAGQYYAEAEGSARVGILSSLGFRTPAELRSDEFFVEVSGEQLHLFDHDVVLWELGDSESKAVVQSDPLYAHLQVAVEGRDVFITDPILAGGMALISLLSLPMVIDQLVPKLAAAVDGNPDTEVPD